MLKIIAKIFFYLFVFIFVSFGIFLTELIKEGNHPAILMYHSIGGPGSKQYPLDVSPGSFEKQMRFLSRHHYNVIPLHDLVTLLKEGKKTPSKTVVITFDDAYENNYTEAYPILKKYNLPATIFVVVNYMGQTKNLYGHDFRFMTPQMALEMQDSGLITIGSHTMNHLLLPSIKDKSVLWQEIRGSKEALEKILGRPVLAFCYPNGGYTPEVEKMVQAAGYQIAVTTMARHKRPGRYDIFALRRIKVTDSAVNPVVFFVETSGYFLRLKELRVKSALRRG